jgi:hypothetical protein
MKKSWGLRLVWLGVGPGTAFAVWKETEFPNHKRWSGGKMHEEIKSFIWNFLGLDDCHRCDGWRFAAFRGYGWIRRRRHIGLHEFSEDPRFFPSDRCLSNDFCERKFGRWRVQRLLGDESGFRHE